MVRIRYGRNEILVCVLIKIPVHRYTANRYAALLASSHEHCVIDALVSFWFFMIVSQPTVIICDLDKTEF